MLIKVTYDKTSGSISIENDVKDITIEINGNATADTSESLYFELAVDTTAYEEANISTPDQPFEEIEE